MTIFVTGIGTDVGKTIASSIIVEALEADYWKPIQSGIIPNTDRGTVERYISNGKSTVFQNAVTLQAPMSPHAAAALENTSISLTQIIRPATQNTLVIEGAGGIFVPINDSETIMDLIENDDQVVVVSRHYLGSINHTLLTIEALKNAGKKIAGIIFNGDEVPSTEQIILKKTGIPMIARIEDEPYFDRNVIRDYADKMRASLQNIVSLETSYAG